jgi:hypothetical protein
VAYSVEGKRVLWNDFEIADAGRGDDGSSFLEISADEYVSAMFSRWLIDTNDARMRNRAT